MKRNEKGFSVVEIIIVIVVVGLLGAVGWLVYDRQKNKTSDSSNAQVSTPQEETPKEEAKKSTPYTFRELGISMDVLNGWEVKANPTKEEGVNFYNWTVEKVGVDGKISLSSGGFRGGFRDCEGSGSLTTATIKEVALTQNANLMFMSWSYSYDNETNNSTSIVRTDETVFRTSNNDSTTAIANKDVKAGSYFFCLSEPQAGFSLKLNNEAVTGFPQDRISALASSSSDAKYVTLPANAQSYADIKAMLTTIK